MKTTFIFVRHGYSIANNKHLVAGIADYALTKTGKKQAQLVAKALRSAKIDAIYSSKMSRAEATAMYVAKSHKLPLFVDNGFMEHDFGIYDGMREKDVTVNNPYFLAYTTDFINATFPKGESTKEVIERFSDTVKRVAKRHEGQTVLVATHGSVLNAFLSFIRAGSNVNNVKKGELVDNCSLTTVEVEDGKFKIIKFNDVSHLTILKSRETKRVRN